MELPEKLAEEIDKDLMDRDDRKPIRKFIDDHAIPATGLALGLGVGAVSALANLKQVNRLKEIK